MKPIETRYNGYRFRSRLEARWAVFFDALGIKWEYEYEGFELSDGSRYLPDFWLPTFDQGMWCEVKYDGGDYFKAECFAMDYECKMWLCEGTPKIAVYRYWDFTPDYSCCKLCGIPNWSQARGENRMYAMPCEFQCKECEGSNPIAIGKNRFLAYGTSEEYIDAVKLAKSARFEHGKKGGIK